MATGTTTNDHEFLFRLQTLIIDGGTLVIKNIFDKKLPNLPLNVYLANEKTTINRLRAQKTITKTQYDQLYPQSGKPPNSAYFDITLLICLLRNLRSLGLNQNYSWYAPPQPADISVEADLCRLKGFRNEVAHISSTSGIQQNVFQPKWTEIENVLLRLNAAAPSPVQTFKQTIDGYLNDPLDPVAEIRIQTIIKQWRKMEKGLETEIQLLYKTVTENVQEVSGLKDDIADVKKHGAILTHVKENVELLTKDIGVVKKDVKNVTKLEVGVETLTTDVKKVKQHVEDIPHVQGTIKTLTEDVTKVKQHVEVIPHVQGTIKTLTEDVTKVKQHVGVIPQVQGTIKTLTENVTEVKQHVELIPHVQGNIKTLTEDVTKVKQHVEVIPQVQENIKTLTEDVTKVKQHVEVIPQVQENIKKLTEDVTKVKQHVEVIPQVHGEMCKMKGVMKEMNEYFQAFKDDKDFKTSVASDPRVPKKTGKFQRYFRNLFSSRSSRPQKELQYDLITFYRSQHRTITLSPMLEEETPLLEFYVMPDIHSLKVQRTLSGVKQEKTTVSSLRNVFYNDNTMYRKIYLTADAGLGKTALSKRLALAWCNANKPHEDEEQYFSQEEIKAVKGFDFVFLLPLRDSSSDCDIVDFIMNQIISLLVPRYTREFIENILFKEQCLVILDGLDEWSHQSNSNSCKQGWSPIPHQKVWERTAVLTTTRPWKLNVSGLKSSQIDQRLEITGLNRESANILKQSVISNMSNEKDADKLIAHVNNFTKDVMEKQMADLEAIPLLLMYLLFLWCTDKKLEQSQCELYSQISELLLLRAMQNYSELRTKVYLSQGDIPQCFTGKKCCTQYYTLLTALGQLAYQTLFKETTEENTLVFDGSVAEQYLNKECLNFCLKTGLITQNKVLGTLLEQKSKMSFAHKTIQEFFAALYLQSTSDQTSVSEKVFSKCESIKNILEMSKILKFSCCMNVNVSSLISLKMMQIINKDDITREYRSSPESSTQKIDFSHPLIDFQNMCISLCKEIPSENEVSLCLQDVFIERNCEQKQYCETLKQLTTRNKQNIRSLYIAMTGRRNTPYSSAQEVIKYFALEDLENIEKIHFKGEYIDRDILPLLNRSVKCLNLSCSELCSWSRLLSDKVTNLQKVEAIHIGWFKMSHSELTLLYDYISQRHCMRQIDLKVLRCTDHWNSCPGYSLDLSKHSQLKKLTLDGNDTGIPLSELNINMTSLEKCRLDLFNPDLVLRFIDYVPADSKLNAFECWGLNPPSAGNIMFVSANETREVVGDQS